MGVYTRMMIRTGAGSAYELLRRDRSADARFDELQCDKARPRELQVRVEQARTTFECQAGLSRRSPKGEGGSQTILSKSGTTEYSANGSLTNPTARRVSRAF